MNIINIPSPNHTSGRRKFRPEAIVIHIMEGTLRGTDSWFSDTRSKVSAHYGIGKKGEVHQYVLEMNTAWHAGRVNAPSWKLIKSAGMGLYVNPNFYTIGIEHEGNEDTEWTEEMMTASAALIKEICDEWNIPLDRSHIIGHHEIYSLKTCPGSKVDINTLITMARGTAAVAGPGTPVNLQKFLETGKVTTTSRLNIRPRPSTNVAPINTIEKNIQLAYDGFTMEGEAIAGNSKWYFTTEGNWFWSGAVTTLTNAPTNLVNIPVKASDFTFEQIREASGAKASIAAKFLPSIADTFAKFQINTPTRRLCFLAQVGHESGGLFFTEELASGRAYEGRVDLGNFEVGDGPRFKGRGLIQITGRSNYKAISRDLNEDFIANPEKLGAKNVNSCTHEQLKYAALSAGWFWNKNALNTIADSINIQDPIEEGDNLKNFKTLTKRINGGLNGLADRLDKYKKGVNLF